MTNPNDLSRSVEEKFNEIRSRFQGPRFRGRNSYRSDLAPVPPNPVLSWPNLRERDSKCGVYELAESFRPDISPHHLVKEPRLPDNTFFEVYLFQKKGEPEKYFLVKVQQADIRGLIRAVVEINDQDFYKEKKGIYGFEPIAD